MTNISTSRYVRDIRIASLVAVIFMIALFAIFTANKKFHFSDHIVSVVVAKFYSGV